MWRWWKKFHDFWMNNEGEMNYWSWVINWGKHEQVAWFNESNKGQQWQFCNSACHLLERCVLGERTKCSHWLMANGTVLGPMNFKVLGLTKTLGFMQQGNGNQQHQTRFDQAIITVWHWNTSCNIKQPWTKHNKHNSCGFSGHSSRV